MISAFPLSAQIDITFKLNMKGQSFPFTTPEVNGTFNSWCGSCNQMTDADGDSIWEAVISLPNGIIEYKFSTDNWANQETLVQGSPCTIFTPPSYLNRKLIVISPIVLNPVCWGSCDTCAGGGPVGPGLEQISLPITWQDTSNVNYTTTDFGGTASSLVADPVDAGKIALKIVKGNTAETWAGTTLGTPAGFPTKIPFAISSTQMQVRVYSPAAGTIFRLKVEDKANPNISVETEAIASQANGWEILTFNFSNPASGTASLIYSNTYNKLSVFPNFGVSGATAGEQTYFIGDVAFGNITTSVNSGFDRDFSISPNPGKDEFLLKAPGNFDGQTELAVFDMRGKMIWNGFRNFSNKQSRLSIPGIRSGIYCLKLMNQGKTIQTRFSVIN